MSPSDSARRTHSVEKAASEASCEDFKSWIGRSEAALDVASAGPIAGLAALLDRVSPLGPSGLLPPLAHWLYFLPRTPQSQLGADGHPSKGGFLPPVPLPRRMWAGSRLHFDAPIPIGATFERRSCIAEVNTKSGRSGAMVFVTVQHEIHVEGRCAVREQQDIVYRDAVAPAASSSVRASAPGAGADDAAPKRISQWTREVRPDPVQLFRFSALTFNAHRIHYDRDYAGQVEGYPGLVVHGPLTAMLLLQHFIDRNPQAAISAFSFRAHRPLFDTAPFSLCMDGGDETVELWTLNAERQVTMTATLLSSET
ncbi:MAG: MaoC family dehydratase N-terminal domain-containing protein [Steroidobacteraceae bacterium]